MGMLNCNIHGWSGVELLTPLAASIFDKKGDLRGLVFVEVLFDDIPFFLCALSSELPFEGSSEIAPSIFLVNNEETLNRILDPLEPRCAKCVRAVN